MKLCLMISSVLWYMLNGLEHTAILSHFLIFITGSSSRLLRIRISAAVTLYWFPVHGILSISIHANPTDLRVTNLPNF